jgi:uncharacterized protein (TIGR03067 family)
MRLCLLPFALVGLLNIAGDAKEDAAKKDREAIQGVWKVMAIEVNGKKADAKDIAKMKWTITAEKITWADGNDFLYKFDGKTMPKQIELTFPERKTETIEGIYSLDGDELKICLGKIRRPTDFTAKAGSRNYLYVLKREKK